jgi:hypothetical protein
LSSRHSSIEVVLVVVVTEQHGIDRAKLGERDRRSVQLCATPSPSRRSTSGREDRRSGR